jgi:hypothetical protein
VTGESRWRGLVALVRDAVEGASLAIERVHKEATRRSFDLLESIPPLAAPARGIHAIHDATVAGVHGAIRLVNGAVWGVVEVVGEAGAQLASPSGSGRKPVPPSTGRAS